MTAPSPELNHRVAAELKLPRAGVDAVARLLDEGATVPFIARYRKEATGGLDEAQIREIEERRAYLGALDERRATILDALQAQGQLSPELRAAVLQAPSKAALEDLWLPFRPKRRTRATIALERGLEPLARLILDQPERADPSALARRLVDPSRGVEDEAAALAGARDIVAERVAERAEVRALAREALTRAGQVVSKVVPAHAKEPTRFNQWYDHREPVATIPSHRYLAMRRGEEEKILRVSLEVDDDRLLSAILARVGHRPRSPLGPELLAAVQDGYKRLLMPSIESEVSGLLKERSDQAAVTVFAQNLRSLLLAPAFGGRPVVGVDPGFRTGCKCVAVDATGRYRATLTVYPHTGGEAAARAAREFVQFVRQHAPEAVAVGNGTAGRETEAFARDALTAAGLSAPVVSVSEAGASVYSASELARAEHPDLDVTVRGALSIARRLQDPLAELVKIDPKAIGVGQYQHDVSQTLLAARLVEVVESCVNHVGVELDTASPALLGYVAGIGPKLATNIVAWRAENGAFRSRKDLLKVPGLGPKTFEQCAGFLRVRGPNPLDASAVHPERYALVERIAADLGQPLRALIGHPEIVSKIDLRRYLSAEVGEFTLRDIQSELARPGRDPREPFRAPSFRADVRELTDLRPGMSLEGVVTNVTAFGAFVDIGVHQDGLIHISQLADHFVRDPHAVVKPGDRVTVRVLEVDVARKRIALTARTLIR